MFQLSTTLYHNDTASRFDNPEPSGQFRQFSSNAELLLGFFGTLPSIHDWTGLSGGGFCRLFQVDQLQDKIAKMIAQWAT